MSELMGHGWCYRFVFLRNWIQEMLTRTQMQIFCHWFFVFIRNICSCAASHEKLTPLSYLLKQDSSLWVFVCAAPYERSCIFVAEEREILSPSTCHLESQNHRPKKADWMNGIIGIQRQNVIPAIVVFARGVDPCKAILMLSYGFGVWLLPEQKSIQQSFTHINLIPRPSWQVTDDTCCEGMLFLYNNFPKLGRHFVLFGMSLAFQDSPR